MRLCAARQAQTFGQLLRNNGLGVIAQHDMNFMFAAIKIVQQTLSVEQAAGPGNGNEYSQGRRIFGREWEYGDTPQIQQGPLSEPAMLNRLESKSAFGTMWGC